MGVRHGADRDIQSLRAPDDVLIVVPARVSSQRFPGKLLAPLRGEPLLRQTVRRAQSWQRAAVAVATDDADIAAAVDDLCPVWLDDDPQPTGSDRVASAWQALAPNARHIINVQGDEPCLPLDVLDGILDVLRHQTSGVVSACVPMTQPQGFENPDVVKVVMADDGRALYFSRAAVPHGAAVWHRHVGVYGFAAPTLRAFAATTPAALEATERLEQLRLLVGGHTIHMVALEQFTDQPWPSINRIEDLDRAEAYLARHDSTSTQPSFR